MSDVFLYIISIFSSFFLFTDNGCLTGTNILSLITGGLLLIIYTPGHNLTGIASQFAMHLGFTCDVISVTHLSD